MGLRWLRLDTETQEQIVETVLAEHYVAILPFKPKSWVLCHKPMSLEEATGLMEAYSSAKAGMYLMPNSWQRKGETKGGMTPCPVEGKPKDIHKRDEEGRHKETEEGPPTS